MNPNIDLIIALETAVKLLEEATSGFLIGSPNDVDWLSQREEAIQTAKAAIDNAKAEANHENVSSTRQYGEQNENTKSDNY